MALPLLALLPLLAGSAAGASVVGNQLRQNGQDVPGPEWLFAPGVAFANKIGGEDIAEDRTYNYPNRGPVNDSPYRRQSLQRTSSESPLDEITFQDYLQQGLGLDPDIVKNAINSLANGGSSSINYLGTPRDMTDDWMGRVQAAYQPQLDYAKSVIPYLEQRGANAQGELVDLYNIAEEGLENTSAQVSDRGTDRAKQQAANIAGIVDAMQADTAATNDDYMSELEALGIGNAAAAQTGAKEAGQAQAEQLGQSGAFMNNALAEESAATADYLSELAAIQDIAAAAHSKDLANQVNGLIFQQQGNIADILGSRAGAELDMLMNGRQDYMTQIQMAQDSERNNVGDLINLIDLQRGLYGDYMGYNDPGDVEIPEYQPARDINEAVGNALDFSYGMGGWSEGQRTDQITRINNAYTQSLQAILSGDYNAAKQALTDAGVDSGVANQVIDYFLRTA